MIGTRLRTKPSRLYVDPTPDGNILLVDIAVDDEMDSQVIQLSPGTAYKLALRLIAVAESVELP